MIKEGCENKSALFIQWLFKKNLNLIEVKKKKIWKWGKKSHYKINIFL